MCPKYLRPLTDLLACVLVVCWLSGCGVNKIPTLDEQVKAAWSEVLNQYQRRADLIPNLVETVKGYAHQEQQVLTQVVEARAKATQMQLPPDVLSEPASVPRVRTEPGRARRRSRPAYWRSARSIRSSNRIRIFWRSNRSSRAPRTASRSRAATTLWRCRTTTPSLGRCPADGWRVALPRSQGSRNLYHLPASPAGTSGQVLMRLTRAMTGDGGLQASSANTPASPFAWTSRAAAEPNFPLLTAVSWMGPASSAPRPSSISLTCWKSTSRRLANRSSWSRLSRCKGYSIEDFGYQLGRHWGIGQRDKNTGASSSLRPKSTRLRIEVGYGLEGELTDAYSRTIIERDVVPNFPARRFRRRRGRRHRIDP